MPRQLASTGERLTRHHNLTPARLQAGKPFKGRPLTQITTSEPCSRSTPAGQHCLVNMEEDMNGKIVYGTIETQTPVG